MQARVCKRCGKPNGVFSFVLPGKRQGDGEPGYYHPRCFTVAKRAVAVVEKAAIADKTMRLTEPQKRVLEHLAYKDDGTVPCGPGMGRTHEALLNRGLVARERRGIYTLLRITDAGRCVLSAQV